MKPGRHSAPAYTMQGCISHRETNFQLAAQPEVVALLKSAEYDAIKVLPQNVNPIFPNPDVDGFFLAIGHIPHTKPFVGQIDLDPAGDVRSNDSAH
jgi:thioredoxin reductase